MSRTIRTGSYSTSFVVKLLIVRSRLKESLRPGMRIMREVNDMMPSPPVWMRMRRMVCPNRVKPAVSTVERPVTQTADVAVKRASIGERRFGWLGIPDQAEKDEEKGCI
jgi:cytochrome P450